MGAILHVAIQQGFSIREALLTCLPRVVENRLEPFGEFIEEFKRRRKLDSRAVANWLKEESFALPEPEPLVGDDSPGALLSEAMEMRFTQYIGSSLQGLERDLVSAEKPKSTEQPGVARAGTIQ